MEPAEDEYIDSLGVISALERTCELESRLRQAIQDTHPLTTTLDWDFNAADREREALLAVSEQLEYLEDKLREYRFLEPTEFENKAVILGQLDSVRRELVEVVQRYLPHITFGKEVAREVLAFAQVEDGGADAGEEEDGEGEGTENGMEEIDEEVLLLQQQQDLAAAAAARAGQDPAGRLYRQGSGSRHGSGSMGGFASEIEAEEEAAGVEGVGAQRTGSGSSGGGGSSRRQYGSRDMEQEATLIPAIRRSTSGGMQQALSRPPRPPAPGASASAKERQLYGSSRQAVAVPSSPKRPSTAGSGGAASPSSLHQQHVAYMQAQQQQQSPTRSAFLQHQQQQQQQAPSWPPLGAASVPGPTGGVAAAGGGPQSGSRSPSTTAATMSALQAATVSAANRRGQRRLDVDSAAVGRTLSAAARGAVVDPGAEAYRFSRQPAPPLPPVAAPPAQQEIEEAEEEEEEAEVVVPGSYPVAPSSYAPSEGIPSSRQSPYTARSTGGANGYGPTAGAAVPGGGGAGAAGAGSQRPSSGRSKLFLLSKLNRAQGGGYGDSASGSRYDSYGRVRDEDIYGVDGANSDRPASIINPSPSHYGGFVRIRDRVVRGDEDSASPVPGPREDRRPRIFGDGVKEGAWEGDSEIQPAAYAATVDLDPPSNYRERHAARQPSPPRERLHLAYSSGGAGVAGPAARSGHSSSGARGGSVPTRRTPPPGATGGAGRSDEGNGSSGGSGLLGRLTNLLLTGAAAAAVAVVAQHAAPVVVQKGQEVARRLQEQHGQLTSKWQAAREQRERSREDQRRQQQQQAQEQQQLRQVQAQQQLHQQQPPVRRTADLPPWQQAQQAQQAAAPVQRHTSGVYDGGSRLGPADPLPPHLAAAAAAARAAAGASPASSRVGSVGGAVSPQRQPPVVRVQPPPHGDLFPAMPPPDVTASMG